jgi:hypothetical protein
MDILLDREEDLFKREVYSFLNMISDIGGLRDGLLLFTATLLGTYTASMLKLSVV